MPICRTSNKSSYDSGFYNPEVYSDVGSRTVNPPSTVSDYWSDMAIQMFGWESLAYIEWWGN